MTTENDLINRAQKLIYAFEEQYTPKSINDDLGSDARAWLIDSESQTNQKNRSEIDIYDLLENRRQVASIWSIEDVQDRRPDLDKNQSWQVLQKCSQCHDAHHGFTWDLLDLVAEQLYPEQ